ncbi:hypothetical protein [Paludibacterium paludis]|uniref:Uncharacterized protein n=1 Tax=Paludibacterium paludis TaxID=1225769 RepID=A0A918UB10_9NEIS|nr:hypothetical protein [Paludibacterium paludis]GGY21795.1 hypothetical protein GCM10011289_26900 [Paludibacterium paludis]
MPFIYPSSTANQRIQQADTHNNGIAPYVHNMLEAHSEPNMAPCTASDNNIQLSDNTLDKYKKSFTKYGYKLANQAAPYRFKPLVTVFRVANELSKKHENNVKAAKISNLGMKPNVTPLLMPSPQTGQTRQINQS